MTHPAQKIRESLFQLLFSQEFADSSPEETLAVIVKEVGLDDKTAVRLLEEWRAYDRRKLFLEEAIERNLSSYKKQELGKIELSLLRCGAYELLEKKTPPPIAISDIIRILKKFDDSQGVALINGVLDAIRRETDGPTAGA